MTTPVTDTLYHYTDSGGLLGIIGSPRSLPGTHRNAYFKVDKGATFGALWATDARYLNDSHEIVFGAELLADKLIAQCGSPSRTPVVAAQLRELAEDVRYGRFNMTRDEEARKAVPYVACFCESGDLLSQWRGYGDGGGGYAIGFRRSSLPNFCQLNEGLLDKYPEHALSQMYAEPEQVIYGLDAAESEVEAFAREVAEDLEKVSRGEKELTWPDIFRLSSVGHLARYKHQAFREEAERRFIVKDTGLDKAKHEFRAGQLGLLPYIKLYFPINHGGVATVREIVVGPGPHSELRKESLQRLLNKVGSTQTEVRLSETPFRG